MTKAHTLSASQVAAFPNVLRSQETMDPMISGRAAAALPAKLARVRPRACRCFLIHSLTPPLSDGFGAGDGTGALPPPVTARTRVLIAMPIAVRMLAIVIPCSRKRVRIRWASVMEEPPDGLTNSVDLDRRAALFVERASSLACLSSSMSESSPLSFSIRSRISCWISVSSVSVSFRRSLAKCFSTSDFRSSMALSFARLLASSSLDLVMASQTPASSGLCDPSDVNLRIINGLQCGLDVFCALSCGISHAGKVLQLDGQCFFGRVSSALWSVSTTSLPSPRDAPDL